MSGRDPDPANPFLASRYRRRDFLIRAGQLGGLAILGGPLLAACGGDDEVADTVTNGEPRPTNGVTEPSADVAVEAAQQYRGTTLNVTWESGLQAQDPIQFSAPRWTELTGININVVELDHPQLYSQAIAEHIAGSGAYDLLNISPAWVPDLVRGGVIEQLDSYVERFMNPNDLADFHPLYEALGTYEGNRWGLFDDGDVLILYYRRDILDEMGITVPTTWDEFQEAAQQITDEMAPDVYGAGFFRQSTNYFTFMQQFLANGGRHFDAETMDPGINEEAGVTTLRQMIAQNQAAPPGVLTWGPVEAWFAFFEGRIAMVPCWPPVGRWAAGYGADATELDFLPESQVVGRVGYAQMPGGVGQHASGFHLAVGSDSDNKEAAYLFAQWLTSPEISLQRVMLPFALRDPYRNSHYESDEYRDLWGEADEYLDALHTQADNAVLDLIMPGAEDYNLALDRACTAAFAGTDPQQALNTAANEWDGITDRLGRDGQREAYEAFLQLPGSLPENTIAAGGVTSG